MVAETTLAAVSIAAGLCLLIVLELLIFLFPIHKVVRGDSINRIAQCSYFYTYQPSMARLSSSVLANYGTDPRFHFIIYLPTNLQSSCN